MLDNFRSKSSNQTILIVILILVALFSNFIISRVVTSPKFNAKTIESLDEKKITVMKLAAASAATSTALTLLPGDIATPISNQIAELSKYFLLILSVILLEKMLVAVVGYISFSYIIPLACILGIVFIIWEKEIFKTLAIKLSIFALIIFLAIPVSMKASDLIYGTHKDSIQETVDTTENNKEYIEEKSKELPVEEKNLLEKIGGYLSDITAKIGSGVSDAVKKGEENFSAFLDAVSTLIITTCVVPLIVILIFIWSIKILFSFDIKLPKRMQTRESDFLEND